MSPGPLDKRLKRPKRLEHMQRHTATAPPSGSSEALQQRANKAAVMYEMSQHRKEPKVNG